MFRLTKKRLSFAMCIVSVVAIALNMVVCSEACAEDMLQIKQSHLIMGKNIVSIAKNGVRIDNVSQLKFVLIASAPTWDVTVYRPDDRTYYKQKLSQFQNTGLLSQMLLGENGQDLNNPKFKGSSVFIDDVLVQQLTGVRTLVRYLPIEGITVPQVERILFATYRLPAQGGIPITFQERQARRRPYVGT